MKVYCVEEEPIKLAEEMRVKEGLSVRLVLTAILSVLGGGFHFGYQVSLINPLSDVLQHFITRNLNGMTVISEREKTFLWSAVAGSLFIGATIGAAIISTIVEKLGPKRGVLISATVLLLSTIISGISLQFKSAELFIVGRVLSGVGVGMGTAAHGVFLAEITPVAFRGIIGSFGGFSTNIGFITAGALGLPLVLGTKTLWPIAYYVEAIPCVVLIVAVVFWFHDSPFYLLKSGQEKAARKSSHVYSNCELGHHFESVRKEMKTISNVATISELWNNKSSRRALFLSVTLNVVVSFSGILAVSFFGTFLLQSIGFSEMNASIANCFSGLAGTVGAFVGTVYGDKIGRRLQVVGSLLLLAAINSCMMIFVFLYNYTHHLWIGCMFYSLFLLFLFCFSAGIGPAAWFLGSELATVETRAKLQSISVGAQYIACFISPLVYYPLNNAVGPFSFLVFIVPLVTSAFYFHRELPETKGRTSQEIQEMLQ